MKIFQSIVLTILCAAGSLPAQTIWKSDKAHSHAGFTVTHLLISEVTGRFTDFTATLKQTTDDFSNSTVEATIQIASVNTDNEFRDKHLRSDDFFNADSFPTMTFTSTKFEKTGKGTYAVAGNLTIRNITKPVVLNAVLKGQYADSKGNVKVGFKATTTIDRFAFGTKWNKTIEGGGLVAGRDVAIDLLLEFNKQVSGSTK